jgi:hypothetical protein
MSGPVVLAGNKGARATPSGHKHAAFRRPEKGLQIKPGIGLRTR